MVRQLKIVGEGAAEPIGMCSAHLEPIGMCSAPISAFSRVRSLSCHTC